MPPPQQNISVARVKGILRNLPLYFLKKICHNNDTMHHYYKPSKNFGFTLAEVLITLGIIGVVAALTLPSLIQSYRDKAIVAQTKKTYSTFSQLLLLAKENGGKSLDEVLQAATSKEEASMAMLNYFLPYLNVVKNCGLERNAGCFGHDVPYYRLNGTEYIGWGSPVYDNFPDRAKVKLADGTSIAFYTWGNAGCHYADDEGLNTLCGQFYVDVNGDKKPNKLGVDLQTFNIYEDKITPNGAGKTVENDVNTDCLDTVNGQGWACTVWVITNENLDYLHCSDLEWGKKTKCK